MSYFIPNIVLNWQTFVYLRVLVKHKRTHHKNNPGNKVHGANMGATWVLSAPDGPHIGPMKLVIGEGL